MSTTIAILTMKITEDIGCRVGDEFIAPTLNFTI